ncbi:MAG: cbb3-type cytochrome c oxidase subunit 3 [Bacteroidetes bacterium]|nr:cbb3-type cytochrome c oxidase subunit 3 [Bacteroidota bacterium]
MRQFLQNLDPALGIYPVIAFVLFSLFFIGVLIWAYTKDDASIQRLKRLPFDESEATTNVPQS